MGFIKRGGILAWGIIPTGDPLVVATESAHALFTRWQEQLHLLCSFGFSKKQLMKQTLIAPSCGTGSLPLELAKKALAMTSEVSAMAKNYYKKSSLSEKPQKNLQLQKDRPSCNWSLKKQIILSTYTPQGVLSTVPPEGDKYLRKVLIRNKK